MADEPANHTIKMLQEMRAEMRQGFSEVRAEMRQGLSEVRAEVRERVDQLAVGLAALSADLKITKEKVEDIDGRMEIVEGRLNTIDGRLARIEKHTGLVKA